MELLITSYEVVSGYGDSFEYLEFLDLMVQGGV